MARHILIQACKRDLEGMPYPADLLPIDYDGEITTMIAANVDRMIEASEDFGGLLVAMNSDYFGLRHYYVDEVAPLIPDDKGGFTYTPGDMEAALWSGMLAARQVLISYEADPDDDLVVFTPGIWWHPDADILERFMNMKFSEFPDKKDGYGFLLAPGAEDDIYMVDETWTVAAFWMNAHGANKLLEDVLHNPQMEYPPYDKDSWQIMTNACRRIVDADDYRQVMKYRPTHVNYE